MVRRAGDHVEHGAPAVGRRRDVQEDQFVRSLVVVGQGAFDRIARVAQRQKTGAFDDAAAGHVQAGNDSFGQHGGGLPE